MKIPLTSTLLERCVSGLPSDLKFVLQNFGPRVAVAGGYVRAHAADEPVADIDLWVTDKATAAALVKAIRDAAGPVCIGTHETDNSTTIRGFIKPVQVIHRWTFESPGALIDSFDYTIAQGAFWYDGTKWESTAALDFESDVQARRLTYTEPQRVEEPAGSLVRLLKFFKKGYSVSHGTLAKVIARAVHTGSDSEWSIRSLLEQRLCNAGHRLPAPPVPADHVLEELGGGGRVGIGSAS